MKIVDHLRYPVDDTWKVAYSCGIKQVVFALPDDEDFDYTDFDTVKNFLERYRSEGFEPKILEPLPNRLHDHIKRGDDLAEKCTQDFIELMKNLTRLGVDVTCFNFMANVGWTRTTSDIWERGAYVTGFDVKDYECKTEPISAEKLWQNYEKFIKAVVPEAEKCGMKLALHPDDPPLEKLGNVERIMTSLQNIKRALDVYPSKNLGVTFCQATYLMMGEDLKSCIRELKDKIFFVHFRNAVGDKTCFHETFHDNGEIKMAEIMKEYYANGIDVPVRVDHVPTYPDERAKIAGYGAKGRLFANGYLKGIMEALDDEYKKA